MKCALSNARSRRHALPFPMNYEDNFGLTNNGLNSRTYDDDIVRYSGGRNYNGQERREKQQSNSAPHKPVSNI